MSIEVDATPQQIWEWMADVNEWPQWKPFIISSSYIKGENLEVGSKIKFKPNSGPKPMDLKAVITESEKPSHIAWEGKMPGLKAHHSFDFEDLGNGKTKVITRETFSGMAVFLFRKIMPQAQLEKLHQDWLDAFKAKASQDKA